MSSKQVTLLALLLGLVLIGVAGWQLTNTLTREGVFAATGRYAQSGHADRTSPSFSNWDNNDPPLVPANCAACHSTTGFLAFLGEDGSTPGTVEEDSPVGTVITCGACHNPSAHRLTQVAFHSSQVVAGLGSEAVCLVCHQTRQSTEGIEGIMRGVGEDEIMAGQGFINPHYNFAASTQYGGAARSGYQYAGMNYAGYFFHAAHASACTDCHNPHSLQVDARQCAACHSSVVTADDLRAIRVQTTDYDGDSDRREGIQAEIGTLHGRLYAAIQQYAREVAGTPIAYADQFPYFFIDTNGNGITDPEETGMPNRYNAWTPRLLRAAYNYQFVKKDAGGYVHNPYYILQLLHDSLSNVGGKNTPTIGLPRP